MTDIGRRKATSFEEYWLASKAWQRKGIALGAARALANAGFLTVDDLQTAGHFELATIPRVGAKSLAILYGLMGREMPEAGMPHGKAIPRGPRPIGMAAASRRRVVPSAGRPPETAAEESERRGPAPARGPRQGLPSRNTG